MSIWPFGNKEEFIDVDRAAVNGGELVLQKGFFFKRNWRLSREDITRIQVEEAYPFLGAVMVLFRAKCGFCMTEGQRDFYLLEEFLGLEELFGEGWRERAITHGQIWEKT